MKVVEPNKAVGKLILMAYSNILVSGAINAVFHTFVCMVSFCHSVRDESVQKYTWNESLLRLKLSTIYGGYHAYSPELARDILCAPS